jgi:hypothetical protein
MLVGALAVHTSLCTVDPPATQFFECPNGSVREQDHVSTITPVSTIRTAPGDELLAAEADNPVSPGAAFDDNLHSIDHYNLIIWTGI